MPENRTYTQFHQLVKLADVIDSHIAEVIILYVNEPITYVENRQPRKILGKQSAASIADFISAYSTLRAYPVEFLVWLVGSSPTLSGSTLC